VFPAVAEETVIEALPLAFLIGLFVVGMAMVIKGGDFFVSSSVAIAHFAKIPSVVIGSTLVSFATTAPELAVSTTASFRGNPELAIGNAVGSAIANIGLILGVLCVLRPMNVRARDFRLPAFAMLGSGLLLFFLTVRLELARWGGVLLIICGAGYLLTDYLRHRPGRGTAGETVDSGEMPARSLGYYIVLFALGAAIVIGGSRLLCDTGVELARRMNIPPMIIGLTLVAFGTSLPELVTAITAARKGVPELSLGNVIGANIMNVTLVSGTAAAIRPLPLTPALQRYNFPAMLIIFVLLLVLARTGRRLTRKEGWVLIGFYALYLAGLILMRVGGAA